MNNGYKREEPVSRTVSDGSVEVREIETVELAVETEVTVFVMDEVATEVTVFVTDDTAVVETVAVVPEVTTEVTVDVLPDTEAAYAPTAATTMITTTIATIAVVAIALLGLEEIFFNIDARNSTLEIPSLFIPKIEYVYYCLPNRFNSFHSMPREYHSI